MRQDARGNATGHRVGANGCVGRGLVGRGRVGRGRVGRGRVARRRTRRRRRRPRTDDAPHEDSVGVGAEKSRATRRSARERLDAVATRHDQPRVKVGDHRDARRDGRQARRERVVGNERAAERARRRAAQRLGEGARRERRRQRLRSRAPKRRRRAVGYGDGVSAVVAVRRRARLRVRFFDARRGGAPREDVSAAAARVHSALLRGVRQRGDARQAARLLRHRGVREPREGRRRASWRVRGARARQDPRRRAPRVEQRARRRQDAAPIRHEQIGRDRFGFRISLGFRQLGARREFGRRRVQRGHRRLDLVRAQRSPRRVGARDAQRLGGVARPEGVTRAEKAQGRDDLRQPGGDLVPQRRERLRRAREEARGRFRRGAVGDRDERSGSERVAVFLREVAVGDGGGDSLERRAHRAHWVQVAVARPKLQRGDAAAARGRRAQRQQVRQRLFGGDDRSHAQGAPRERRGHAPRVHDRFCHERDGPALGKRALREGAQHVASHRVPGTSRNAQRRGNEGHARQRLAERDVIQVGHVLGEVRGERKPGGERLRARGVESVEIRFRTPRCVMRRGS